MPPLNEVIISVTNRCNLRCRMCDIPKDPGAELPSDVWGKVIADARELGARTIIFSGGEPLMREDILELIAFAKGKSLKAGLTSNGQRLDEDMAREFARLGVDVVNISLEGDEATHDQLRGRGSFAQAISALDHLRKHKVESTVATMVSGRNYRHLKQVVELAREHGASTIKFQPFSGIFIKDAAKAADFLVPEGQSRELEGMMNEVIGLCRAYRISTNPETYLRAIPGYLTGITSPAARSCPALFGSCPINSQGDDYPCWVMGKKAALGSVKDLSLVEIWNSARRQELIRGIEAEGCPTCLMSCYDDNFAKEPLPRRLVLNTWRAWQQGPLDYLKQALKRSKRSVVRSLGALTRRRQAGPGSDISELERALKEIHEAKRGLRDQD